jgi:hypothetical protein
MNKVSICDANLLPNPNKLAEEFASCYIMLLLNFFLGYN